MESILIKYFAFLPCFLSVTHVDARSTQRNELLFGPTKPNIIFSNRIILSETQQIKANVNPAGPSTKTWFPLKKIQPLQLYKIYSLYHLTTVR